jgi:hypothetical protein
MGVWSATLQEVVAVAVAVAVAVVLSSRTEYQILTELPAV